MKDVKNVMKGIQISLTDLIGDNLYSEEIKERCETLLKWINKDGKDDIEYIDYVLDKFGQNSEESEKRILPIDEKSERIEQIEKALDEVNNIVSKCIIKEEAERKKRAEQEAKESAERKKQADDLPF